IYTAGSSGSGSGLAVTVTFASAVLPPSSVVATAVAEPAFRPVTLPLPSMVNVAGLPDFQATVYLVALPGASVAFSVAVLPVSSDNVVLSSDTPVTGCVAVLNDNGVLSDFPA